MDVSQFWRMMKRPGHGTKCTLSTFVQYMREDLIQRMVDGTPAVTKAGEELFADCDQCEDSLRLMCWSHVHHSVTKSSQFKHLRSVDKILAEALLADIETIFVCEANQLVLMLCVSITVEVIFLHNDLNYLNERMTGRFADN